ncbi:MAG: Fic family protein [Sphingomonas pseudosanguinis]|uniref:Fic family protein n=1 Tax=Sphingomonas pseudosanguinis TaxID=413712 RepID=UPI00391CE92A
MIALSLCSFRETAVPDQRVSTSVLLAQWEAQSTAAERMSADILRVDGFRGIDPQCPLGGPDGGKDILCAKDGLTFVAACYFPTGDQTFAATRTKFDDDLESSLKHKRDAFIFMTNQKLTPGERADLEQRAAKKGKRCIIYAREHLRVALDSPQGYGVRLQHLRVPMTTEEQAAYFSSSGESVATALAQQTEAIDRLAARVDQCCKGNRDFVMQTVAVLADAVAREGGREDIARMLEESATSLRDQAANDASGAPLSANLSTALLRYVHRLLLPSNLSTAGYWRQTQVFLGSGVDVLESVEFPTWAQVPAMMQSLVNEWNASFPELQSEGTSSAQRIDALARFFHRLLSIHPFVDGNGRLARAVLALQVRDLFGLDYDVVLDRGADYYEALRLADTGDASGLIALITEALDSAVDEPL